MLSIFAKQSSPQGTYQGGVGTFSSRGVIHVQYADDIVLMIDGSYSYEPLLDRKLILF